MARTTKTSYSIGRRSRYVIIRRENLETGTVAHQRLSITDTRAIGEHVAHMTRDGVFVQLKGDTALRRVSRLLGDGDSNTKLRKSNKSEAFRTVGLSLSPADEIGYGNMCPHASDGCAAACLDHQGMASVFAAIRFARMAKTVAFHAYRQWFLTQLRTELRGEQKSAERAGFRLACRLNVFSDYPWESTGIVGEFPDVTFYDYTKDPRRVGDVRPNYWLTFSRSEENHDDCKATLEAGQNVTVVFADTPPATWQGYRVIDGDESDMRFDDPRGVVVGLKLKAHSHAERDAAIESGFAI